MEIKAREERKSNDILFYPASWEAVGGRKTEGERNPQLLSVPIKSSNPAFRCGAEDVIDSETEGVLEINWVPTDAFHMQGPQSALGLPPSGTEQTASH